MTRILSDMFSEDSFFADHGMRPTSNRLLVFRAIRNSKHPLSLAELEDVLPDMDRSSIFRSLAAMSECGILRSIQDGDGILKYETTHPISSTSEDQTFEGHVHFFCTRCRLTYCFPTQKVPEVAYPPGFQPKSVNYMASGICPHCAKNS